MILRKLARWFSTLKNRSGNTPLVVIKGKLQKKGSTSSWLQNHSRDIFVRMAAQDHYPCRSAYKLIHIDEKFKLLKQGITVVDLGAFPGGWTKVAIERVNSKIQGLSSNSSHKGKIGKVISVDKASMNPVLGATVFGNCDINDFLTLEKIKGELQGKADVVLSDMAVNACGIPEADFDKNLELCRTVLKLIPEILKKKGKTVLKLTGNGSPNDFIKSLKENFSKVKFFRPESTRKSSSEVFIVCLGYGEKNST
ncbi:ribosomal RNA large subunit methyltransferase E-like [Zophobas morio]|jgi:23S rRNA (uridine2552-2'-O)-methyltransferase|uniref:ribosomal RNA large subunit methyltransferase E-like n=1 Tax=Zophobas morio TaxID=2755281 RepID=UPI003082A466